MSRPRFEGEERLSIQPIEGDLPRQPMSLAQRLAHRYDSTPRKPAVLGDRDGFVIGGTGGNARPATLAEISHVLNGGVHVPLDAKSLEQPVGRQSHGDFVRASRQGYLASAPHAPQPFEADYKRTKAEREARKAEAKALKNKGNKGRKSA